MSFEFVMPSNHLVLCRTLLFLPSVFPSIGVFSSESAVHIKWPKHWSFSFSMVVAALIRKSESEATQLCLPTLCHPMDCSLPGSSVHGIFQARVLERVAISFSRGSSQPRDRTQVPHIVGRCFYHLREAKDDPKRTSLAVQRLIKTVLPMQAAWVQSLVKELRFYVPCGVAPSPNFFFLR